MTSGRKKEEQKMQSLGSVRISPELTTSTSYELDYRSDLVMMEE